jgi:hypothetical protein
MKETLLGMQEVFWDGSAFDLRLNSLRQGDWKEVKQAQSLFRVGDERGKLQRLFAQRIVPNDGSDAWHDNSQPLNIEAHRLSIRIHPDPSAPGLNVPFLVNNQHGKVFELAKLEL